MFQSSIFIILVSIYLSGCGGDDPNQSSPNEEVGLKVMPTFKVVDDYDVLIDTLVDQIATIDTDQFNTINNNIEYSSTFSVYQTTGVGQITWSGMLGLIDSRDLDALQFELRLYEVNNGLTIENTLLSKVVTAQVLALEEISLLENIFTLNVEQADLFILKPGEYQLSIVAAESSDFTHYWLEQNNSLLATTGAAYSAETGSWVTQENGRSVRIAGNCIGECKRYQTGSDTDDVLIGDEQTNYLKGAKGFDLLIGGYGDDYYHFSRGDGTDVFTEFDLNHGLPAPVPGPDNNEGTGNDVLVFEGGIRPDELNFLRIDFDLHIYIYDSNDQITIKDWFWDDSTKIEILRFPLIDDFNISGQGFYETSSDIVDWVTGDAGDNVLKGLAGSDIISGRGGNDELFGDSGDDTLVGGLGADILNGGEGSDTAIYYDSEQAINISLDHQTSAVGGTAEGDTYNSIENVVGSDFDDVIRGDLYNNKLEGRSGDDELSGGDGADTINGDAGNDTIWGERGSDTIAGNQGDDKLYGGSGSDVISGGSENDELYGDAHNDTLNGGSGDDILYGGVDSDLLLGGEGQDSLVGGDHDDILYGEAGLDTLFGNKGNDFLSGGEGSDTLLSGGDGNDVISGGSGSDALEGNSGDDTLSGGDENDSLLAGEGNDYLVGGLGNDYLKGESDADVYIFSGEFGQDIIEEDSSRSIGDELVFSGYELKDLWFHESENDLTITLIGTENKVTLLNYANFGISSDLEGNAILEVENAVENKSPILSMTFPVSHISATVLRDIIDDMAQYSVPLTIEDRPVIIGL